jgi:hypothetical protein
MAYSQPNTIPQNPNQTDAKGLRQGKWTILFDKDWKPITDEKQMEFFRTIEYKDDKPIGIVKDHYKNGIVQMEATFLADRPTEVMDGVVIFYDTQGKKETESTYKNGNLQSEKSFADENSWKALNDEGLKLYGEGKYKEAGEFWEKAKIQAEKEFGKEHPDYATSCNNLAFLYKSQGLYAKAEPLYIEAKNIREKVLGKEHPDYATSCVSLAFLYESQGLYVKAEPLYIEAKNIFEKVLGKEHPKYAISCNSLAFLYDSQGLYAKAEPLYVEGIKPLLSQIDNNFSMLSEKEKGLFYKSFSNNFEQFTSFSAKRYQENPAISTEVYNNTLATKALLFSAGDKMRTRILGSKDETLIALFEQWKAKKATLIKVYEMSIVDKQKKGIDVPALEAEANELEKQLSQKSEIFATVSDKKRYTWTDVQKKLKPNEVAIEMIRFKVYDKKWTDSVKYMALIIKPESKYPEMVVLENGNELESKYAKNYQNCIKARAKDKLSYAQYWSKIETQLKGVKKIYLSVDGVYNSLSIQQLQLKHSKL